MDIASLVYRITRQTTGPTVVKRVQRYSGAAAGYAVDSSGRWWNDKRVHGVVSDGVVGPTDRTFRSVARGLAPVRHTGK